jgi:predicted RecA/RadA family phage recombinase
MRNFIQPGKVLDLTAPSGGVVSGNAYKIGQLLVVATVTAAEGETFAAQTEGVVELPKTSAQAWTPGALIYWDPSPGEATTAATAGNHLIGTAVAAAANPSATGRVKLLGHASPDTT